MGCAVTSTVTVPDVTSVLTTGVASTVAWPGVSSTVTCAPPPVVLVSVLSLDGSPLLSPDGSPVVVAIGAS